MHRPTLTALGPAFCTLAALLGTASLGDAGNDDLADGTGFNSLTGGDGTDACVATGGSNFVQSCEAVTTW